LIQAGNSVSFSFKSLSKFGLTGMVIGKDFDGDDPVEMGVAGAVYLTHSSRTGAGENLIRAQTSARHDFHGHVSAEYSAVKWLLGRQKDD
jgi:hypothetical protein